MRWLPPMLHRSLSDDSPLLSRGVPGLLVSELDEIPDAVRRDPPSDRELEVLRLIGEGLTNAEIADALAVSVSTVKTHVRHLLAKLHVANRVQLALQASSSPDKQDY